MIFTGTVNSFNKIIGSDAGNDFHAAANTSNTYVGGAASDIYRSESGGDTVTGGGGADTFGWFRKYAEVGHTDRITDFQVGVDKLDLSDFLKGQAVKNPAYNVVIHLQDMISKTVHTQRLCKISSMALGMTSLCLIALTSLTSR